MTKHKSYGYLFQDLGLVLLLACLFTGALTVSYTPKPLLFEAVLMLLFIFLAILLTGFKLFGLSIVLSGLEVLIYTAYRLYLFLAYETEIPLISFVWIFLPILSVAAMYLFVSGNRKLELENDILREQVEELVMVNPLTKLYNLRSLYHDLYIQVSYAERNKLPLSLMVIVLKYESELKSILSRQNYERVIQRLAQIVSDTVRVEDKTYSTDHKGSLAIIMTCDKEGSEIAMGRLRSRISERDAFSDIADHAIKIEVKMASMEYSKEEFGDDMMQFKQRVENELQYDV
ncbi:diguanylate cyclase [Lacrimispora xylanolytica]|uniref:Diguanylate cyclase n=1 Tax=Lacrimispora xylanolytica TaxID=29375 RepID=A0ABY7AFS8_9FIRM|nr:MULTISPECIES: diguanylate cyclase [Clostridia]WAJ25322.1 diguanylate cyclase [Lacrimispora xylanolytica]